MENGCTKFVPLEERSVDFYGDRVSAALVQAGGELQVYVPLRPICDYLGLAWSGQFERIQRDEVLSQETVIVRLGHKREGRSGDPDLLCLLLDYLPGWLFSISTSRVRPALRPVLSRYRHDCFRVLAEAFPRSLTLPRLDTDDSATMTACSGTVYVVEGDRYHKIGVSRNVEARLSALSASLPFEVTPVCTIETDDMFRLERQLHLLYRSRGKHINGEWFVLSAHDIAALKTVPSPLPSTRFAEILTTLGPVAGLQ